MSEEVEVRSKQLQRYYDNKEIYNEKAKKYFRNVWYVENREKILLKQKLYRESRKPKMVQVREITLPTNRSLIVSFD
jgi:hypothetical protein